VDSNLSSSITERAHVEPQDLYLASHGSVFGIGGGAAVINQLAGAFERRGLSTLRLGIGDNPSESGVGLSSGRLNLAGAVPAAFWRFRNLLMPRRLAAELCELPPPRGVFVGLNPLWIVAAKKAWPDTPIVFLFAASLTNCQPFTWGGRKPSLWQRVDHAALSRAERRALDTADRVIVPTCQSQQELAEICPSARNRIVTCTYGAELRSVDNAAGDVIRRDLGLSSDDLLALAIGVCNRNKAFDLAVSEMRSTIARTRLAVICSGPEYCALEKLIRDSGLGKRVFLRESQPDLAPWYSAADCVVSTSCYDTFPYVMLDGMCFGRPVLVPRHDPPHAYSGIAEIVREHGGGVIYDRTRNGALAAALNRLTRDLDARRAIGRTARDVARRLFTWDACIDLILKETPGRGDDVRTTPDQAERESLCV